MKKAPLYVHSFILQNLSSLQIAHSLFGIQIESVGVEASAPILNDTDAGVFGLLAL